jgi:hypothetical protein
VTIEWTLVRAVVFSALIAVYPKSASELMLSAGLNEFRPSQLRNARNVRLCEWDEQEFKCDPSVQA